MKEDECVHVNHVWASTAASNQAAPCNRSAACLVSLPEGGGLLLLAGDTGEAGRRLADVWRFDATQVAHGLHPWELLSESSGTDRLEARSNAAAAVAGNSVAVFGGWHASGLAPLARLQVFDLEQQRWSDPAGSHANSSSSGGGSSSGDGGAVNGGTLAASASLGVVQTNGTAADQLALANGVGAIVIAGHGGAEPGAAATAETARRAGQEAPCARGQPSLTTLTDGGAMLLFGGWNGKQRFNDLWRLDTSAWQWSQLQPSGQPPPARADHVATVWRYCDCGHWKDILVVHGGSSADGLLGDVWTYDVDTNSWRQAHCGGSTPSPRSSHAAALLDGHLLVSGGQAQGEVLSDLHVLQLSTLTWLPLPSPEPLLPPRCRHSLAVAATSGGVAADQTAADGIHSSCVPTSAAAAAEGAFSTSAPGAAPACVPAQAEGAPAPEPRQQQQQQHVAWLFGGFDGSRACGEMFQIVLPDGLNPQQQGAASSAPSEEEPSGKHVLSLEDLEAAVRTMPPWKQVRRLHAAALEQQRDQYIDPASGYTVWTAHYLKQRPCCGNACRHCPWGHENVVKTA